MKFGPITYKPNTSWITAALLAVVLLGFGAVAESHTDTSTPIFASEAAEQNPIPQAILRLF